MAILPYQSDIKHIIIVHRNLKLVEVLSILLVHKHLNQNLPLDTLETLKFAYGLQHLGQVFPILALIHMAKIL